MKQAVVYLALTSLLTFSSAFAQQSELLTRQICKETMIETKAMLVDLAAATGGDPKTVLEQNKDQLNYLNTRCYQAVEQKLTVEEFQIIVDREIEFVIE